MSRISLVVIIVLTLAACASEETVREVMPDGVQIVKPEQAVLKYSSVPGDGVGYDRSTNTCTAGSFQMLSPGDFETLIEGWQPSIPCDGASVARVPEATGYPSSFAKLEKSGSAQVLVRLEADGFIKSVHAVCATDPAFGEAAVQTARTISYVPANCGGIPMRSAFLLPLDYSF